MISISEAAYRNKITHLKWFLAVGVAYIHAYNVEVYQSISPPFYVFEYWLNYGLLSTCVPCFFALSGFLFYQDYKSEKLLQKWKTRLKSVVAPYVIWSLIGYFYYALLSAIPVIRARLNTHAVTLSFSSLLQDILISGHNEPLWFMRYLIIYIYIADPISSPKTKVVWNYDSCRRVCLWSFTEGRAFAISAFLFDGSLCRASLSKTSQKKIFALFTSNVRLHTFPAVAECIVGGN